ncbi:hypothetical protein PDE_08113 [Penicillium oxalicum 114-2]|uniref:Uncharacterized protein n=1 Tax=Penicillium oxalicum (strain 114-2 / CGMCC 5302) TaxID=933388 RepID=S7ZWK0_PENO1|nr:hypothetical protein PDE_08113 [Penicillium oxalicum 114-2]
MPLFRSKKAKSSPRPSISSPPSQPPQLQQYPPSSGDQLVHPAFSAPPDPIHPLINSNRSNNNNSNPHIGPHQSEPRVRPSSLHRSQSYRQPHLRHPDPPHSQTQQRQHDRSTIALIANEKENSQPRRPRKNFLGRPTSGLVERRLSVKGKPFSHSTSQPSSPQVASPPGLGPTEDEPYSHRPSQSSNSSSTPQKASCGSRVSSLPLQQQRYQPSQRDPLEPSRQPAFLGRSQPVLRPPASAQLRTNTDPVLGHRTSGRAVGTDTSPAPGSLSQDQERRNRRGNQLLSRAPQQDLVQPSRTPSQHTLESSSRGSLQSHPDAMQQAASKSPQPPAQLNHSTPQSQSHPPQSQESQGSPSAHEPHSDDSHRQSSQPHTMADTATSTPVGHRGTDDMSEIDVRALLQKHEELQTKYSKVKRYYFDKEAQVQHLQNTVAHQRMAVSRTVLDDNEYANRFIRLDGAIKDLAFSVRKDWRTVPGWLHGLVTEETTAKEMTAAGRAVISRWLVEEVFHRHFHPRLDPALSIQLKSIEMNLRRQQVRPPTEEERENVLVRISNWRRTTFDGLGDVLSTPAAQKHRDGLVDYLTADLAGFLSSQLHESAQPGLEAGVRMIIENTLNITEKIPLEARDVSVEYFLPHSSFDEAYMKTEGVLPPLTHQPSPPPPATPADVDGEEGGAPEGSSEASLASSSLSAGDAGSAPPQKTPRKSVFGALMGRRPLGPASGRSPAGAMHEEKLPPVDDRENASRIRFASFLAVEVRGKGTPVVLVKAPVWLLA